jgi:hypothetical protein
VEPQPEQKESGPREYRLDVRLPRDVSAKLNAFQKEVFAKSGKRHSKSEIVTRILQQFFDE